MDKNYKFSKGFTMSVTNTDIAERDINAMKKK